MSDVWAVPFIDGQRELISDYCWGPGCGKGAIGALTLDDPPLECLPCGHAVCPIMERESDPIGEVNGDTVRFRKLRRPDEEADRG